MASNPSMSVTDDSSSRSLKDGSPVVKLQPDTPRSFTQSEVITIFVGPKRKAFAVHKDLLVSQSPYFAQCLSNPEWKESSSKEIYWDEKDDKVDAAETMVDWLYGRKPDLARFSHNFTEHVLDCYKLADKRLMSRFKNALLDALRDCFISDKLAHNSAYASIIGLVAARRVGLGESELYNFMLQSFVWGLKMHKQAWESGVHAKELAEALQNAEIANEVTKELAWGGGENPSKLVGCHFHDHSDGSSCGTGTGTGTGSLSNVKKRKRLLQTRHRISKQ